MDLLSGRSVYHWLVAQLVEVARSRFNTRSRVARIRLRIATLFIGLGLISSPVVASPLVSYAFGAQSFTFIDFSIAFVLGLSLPMLLLVLLVRRLVPNPWWYFTALMLSALGFLYSLNYLTDNQAPAVLSFAISSISLVYLWSFASSNMLFLDGESEYFAHVKLGEKVLIAASILYVITIWLLPSIDAYVGWLAFAALVLFTGAVQIAMMAKVAPEHVIRLVGQWLLVGLFCGVIFFYLHAQVALEWLITSFVLSFCGALVNSNWELVQRIYQLITEQKEASAKQLTDEQIFSFTHDPATNLPSYQQAILRFEQLSFQNQLTDFAVVVVKPKNFADVNRVLGHQNSDLLLLQLAYCLKREVADLKYLMNFDFSDINAKLARLPSLHFMLAIDLNKIEHSKEIVVDQLCRQLASAVPPAMSFKSFSLRFELACGVAYTNDHGQTLAEVIAHAGDAVMEAQRKQVLWAEFNAQVALHSDQQLQRMERLKLDIEQDKIHWQLLPQIDLGNHQIRGFTLAANWHYNGKDLALNEFIEVAEQSGEIYSLMKKMIVQAFKALFELRKLNVYQPIGIPVLSDKLLEPDLAEFIEQQIATYNISAKYLVVQLSEPVMQVACEQAKHLIDQLKTLEVGICIAEFDGSYESLRYIRKLSVDQVNISCQPLCMAEAGSAEKAIVNSLVSLARTMKLAFVGSHVNSKQGLTHYSAMGGQVVEGSALSPAINVGEIATWTETWFKRYPSAHTRNSTVDI